MLYAYVNELDELGRIVKVKVEVAAAIEIVVVVASPLLLLFCFLPLLLLNSLGVPLDFEFQQANFCDFSRDRLNHVNRSRGLLLMLLCFLVVVVGCGFVCQWW